MSLNEGTVASVCLSIYWWLDDDGGDNGGGGGGRDSIETTRRCNIPIKRYRNRFVAETLNSSPSRWNA